MLLSRVYYQLVRVRMNNDDIFSATYLCRSLSIAYGFATYTAQGPPKMKLVKISYPLYFAAFAIQLGVILFCLVWNNARFEILYKHAGNLSMPLLNIIFAVIDEGRFCFIIFSEKYHAPMIVKFWRQMQTMENELARTGIRLNYTKLKNLTLLVTLSELIATNVACVVFIIASSGLPLFHTTMYWLVTGTFYYIGAANSILLNNMMVAYGVMAHMFERLKTYAENELVWNTGKLMRVSKHHDQLCNVVKELSRIYSLELLTMYVQLFIIFTIRGFDIALLVVKVELTLGIFLTVAFTIFMVIRCVMLIHVLHNCAMEVRFCFLN